MKRNLIVISSLLFGALYAGTASAQQSGLAPDQNPRYRESQEKYYKIADSLISQHGTTVQNTYKAYDWYEAKLERRRQRREWRHEERMNGYYGDFYPSLSLGFGYNPFGGYNYGNYYGSRYGGRSNFWFGW